jgi:uncharacterized protein (TIGR02145 family)
MKKIIYLIIFILLASITLAQNKKLTLYYHDSTRVINIAGLDSMTVFICGASKVSYAGKDYNTVLIGNQCWLKENLNIGTMVQGSSNQLDNGILEKYCYNNDPNNCNTYGGLYQWNEAMKYVTAPQGICPNSWHIPTYTELQTLKTIVNNDGNSLKAIGQGSGNGTGTNTSGFSGLLAGTRNLSGNTGGLSYYTLFWSSTEFTQTYAAYSLQLSYNNSQIDFFAMDKVNGHSIRCIRD